MASHAQRTHDMGTHIAVTVDLEKCEIILHLTHSLQWFKKATA